MTFDFNSSLPILERTPNVVGQMLSGLSDEWTTVNEGGDSWTAFDVVGHLTYCDTYDWLVRIKHILHKRNTVPLPPFDRFAQLYLNKHKSLEEVLLDFKTTRQDVLKQVQDLKLGEHDYQLDGLHADLGAVKLSQLLAAWVVHDLSHLSQIARIMAMQYKSAVGPWIKYLRILN
jgi:DinB family protein